jgi:hypothetical protein
MPAPAINAIGEEETHESIVEFRCPQCHERWQARLIGEDIRPMPRRAAISH